MSTQTQEGQPLAISQQELNALLLELGMLKEKERHREQEQARVDSEREAAEAERQRVDIARVPLVTIEWEKPPQEHSCTIGGRRYTGKGPLVHPATKRKVKPGSRARIPACDAVVLDEAGFATIVEGRELCEGMWTPQPFMPGVVDNMPAGDSKQWEKLAVG